MLLIYLAPLGVAPHLSSVWDANEAFYVQTPREMLERGEWLVPYFNDQPRLNKPPLSYWLVAGAYRVFGVSLAVERWLLAALGAGCVLLAFAIARRFVCPSSALLAAGVFATNFRFLMLSRRLLIDILMLACILAGTLCFVLWRERPSASRLRLAALCFGLAFLAKGPVAWIGLAILLLVCFCDDRCRSLRRGAWASSLAVLVTVSFSWYLALGWSGDWESVLNFFLRENLGRFASLDYGPERNWFYYLGVILADSFPWSLLFFAAVGWQAWRWRGLPAEERRNGWLLALWIAVWFVLFSFSRNKQEYYILPLYPAAAIWVAQVAQACGWARWLAVVGGAAASLLGCGQALLASELFGPSWLWWLPTLLFLVFGLLAALRRWHWAAASLSLVFVVVFALLLPRLEDYRPVHHLAARAQLELEPGGRAGYLGLAAPSLRFYLDQPVLELFDVAAAAAELDSPIQTLLVVQESDWPDLQRATRTRLRVVARSPRLVITLRTLLEALLRREEGSRKVWVYSVYLVSNRPEE